MLSLRLEDGYIDDYFNLKFVIIILNFLFFAHILTDKKANSF